MSDISHNPTYAKLIEWMVDNNIELSSLIKIDKSPIGGVGVFSTGELLEGEILLRVPKDNVLSPSTCGIADLLYDNKLDGMIGLTIAYMFEKGQGEGSPWYPFLNTIQPPDYLLPRFWPEVDRDLLKGTELDLMGGLDEGEVIDTYKNVVLPFINDNKEFFASKTEYSTYQGYKQALVEVCSRAFEVDEYRGLSLVPGACLFNHSDNENVHFESENEVCDVCGAANYCDHIAYKEIEFAKMQGELEDSDFEDVEEGDEEEEIGVLVEPNSDDEDDCGCGHDHGEDGHDHGDEDDHSDDDEEEEDEPDCCEIVVVNPVKSDQEIFNTYGEYSNGILLSRYGFCIWDNQHETVSLAPQILQYAKKADLKPRLKWWAKHFYQCIFNINPDDYEEVVESMFEENPEELPPPPPDSLTWKETLEIVSSGQPTPGLILLINLLSLNPKKYALLQTQAKRGKYSALPTGPEGCVKILYSLVTKRLSNYKDAGLTSDEYSKLIEENDIADNKRLAFTILGTEKLVLERCLKNL